MGWIARPHTRLGIANNHTRLNLSQLRAVARPAVARRAVARPAVARPAVDYPVAEWVLALRWAHLLAPVKA